MSLEERKREITLVLAAVFLYRSARMMNTESSFENRISQEEASVTRGEKKDGKARRERDL